jgi:hypothetical protein
VKSARLRRPKVACSLSYVDYRPSTNAAILWDTSHTKGRAVHRREEQGTETEILSVVDVLSV